MAVQFQHSKMYLSDRLEGVLAFNRQFMESSNKAGYHCAHFMLKISQPSFKLQSNCTKQGKGINGAGKLDGDLIAFENEAVEFTIEPSYPFIIAPASKKNELIGLYTKLRDPNSNFEEGIGKQNKVKCDHLTEKDLIKLPGTRLILPAKSLFYKAADGLCYFARMRIRNGLSAHLCLMESML